jgi:hypothetical protein
VFFAISPLNKAEKGRQHLAGAQSEEKKSALQLNGDHFK